MELSPMSRGNAKSKKTDKSYWEHLWKNTLLLQPVDPYCSDPNHYLDRKFHDFFSKVFSNRKTQNTKLLEIGCARSVWLPYFAKKFGFKVTGIDYSESGCQQALQLLSKEGVEGEIVCADFFSPPESMIKGFDIVISFGVLEHFQDTQGCILMFSKYLKQNGMLITNIPNLTGVIGLLQKILNQGVFDMHISLSPGDISEAHRKNAMEVVSCDYFLFANFGVVNYENLKDSFFYPWILQSFCWLNRGMWFFEKLMPFKPNRWSSPYIQCVAIKSS